MWHEQIPLPKFHLNCPKKETTKYWQFESVVCFVFHAMITCVFVFFISQNLRTNWENMWHRQALLFSKTSFISCSISLQMSRWAENQHKHLNKSHWSQSQMELHGFFSILCLFFGWRFTRRNCICQCCFLCITDFAFVSFSPSLSPCLLPSLSPSPSPSQFPFSLLFSVFWYRYCVQIYFAYGRIEFSTFYTNSICGSLNLFACLRLYAMQS